MRPALDIVIPVYNEGGSIRTTLAGLYPYASSIARVLLVYDFPEDNTLAPAAEFAATHENLILQPLRNTHGRGALNAIRSGLEACEADYCLVCMGDAADDYSALLPMLEKMEAGSDLVCGSRYMPGGKQIGGPLLKGLLSRTAGLTLHWLTGLPTHDATNSFKMYRRGMLSRLSIESRGGFEIGMELLVKGFLAGYRIAEVPCTWKDRSDGESRFRLWRWLPHYLHWYFLALRSRFRLRPATK